MSRNLLPRLRARPTPANISPGTAGAWSTITNPGELAKIEYKEDEQAELRTRIQSIPSPWARMLLFRAALEDPGHPARAMVENEILDALEFMWSLSRLSVSLNFQRVELAHVRELGDRTGSRRAKDVADAFVELAPRAGAGRGEPEVTSVTIALAQGRPVFASSPYTGLFTAEDAAEHARVETFFGFARGGVQRHLCDREIAFQEYVAQVLAPQLYTPAPAGGGDTWGRMQGLVRPWLEAEIHRCAANARDEETRRRVSLPVDRAEWDWRSAAEQRRLEPVNEQAFGGLWFFRQRRGAELAHSPLRLRSTRSVEQTPLVLTSDRFHGYYYPGSSKVSLPPEFRTFDRTRLPGLGIEYPWISPADDWLTDRIILLSEPIERDHVHGYAAYHWRGNTQDPRFTHPHMLLPLRSEFFRYFAPEDVDRMLSVDAHPGGRIEVTLSIPIGADPAERISVRRSYRDEDILNEHGPAFSLWPSFADPGWSDYVLFRNDTGQTVAQQFAVRASAGGVPLSPGDQERRTPLVEATVFDRAPDVLELYNTLRTDGDQPESVGVLLPRYRAHAPRGPESWEVGVDFGTSNTVVSVHASRHPAPQLFRAQELVLTLTEPSPNTSLVMDAYFFPRELAPTPFGTAVVYHESLRSFELDHEPLALRINVPFAGDVDGYQTNRVKGDLKWSADPHAHFLSASFLRHVLATVIAQAIQQGVDPSRISFRWAYPRAFSQAQLNRLRTHWQHVLRTFAPLGVREDAMREELDESRSVLRYFFNANLAHPAGDVKAIVDVGGGTSDIALYGRGRVLALDSVVFGGRNLTGSRLQSGAEREGNPFVEAFFAWAKEHGLPQENRNAVQAYLDRDQVHLAFSYLVGTRWFRERGGGLFAGHEVFHRFQSLVFYFFGALFYYLGLSLRSLTSETGEVELPVSVLIAGNGSRYLDWLTDLTRDRSGENVFTRALGYLLAHGAGIESPARIPRITVSRQPKEEVALGLVARVGPGELPDADALTTPVVGEAVTLRLREEDELRTYSPASRFDSRDVIETKHVHTLRWHSDTRQIEAFHVALLRAAESVTEHGEQWARVPQRYREFFGSFGRAEIQDRAEGRLQFLAELEQGFRGSLLLLEAVVVLEEMRDQFFASVRHG